jgi:hypothetical protein
LFASYKEFPSASGQHRIHVLRSSFLWRALELENRGCIAGSDALDHRSDGYAAGEQSSAADVRAIPRLQNCYVADVVVVA